MLPSDLGRIEVNSQVLFTENRAQTLIVLTARPGTGSQSKVELLSVVIGHQQLSASLVGPALPHLDGAAEQGPCR